MEHYTQEDIFRLVEEEDVEFIRLQFTDLQGNLKNIALTSGQLQKALDNKCKVDASPLMDFNQNAPTDLFLHPDLDTFEIFPWRPQQGKVARLFCSLYTPDGKPYEGDPRVILKRAIADAAELGYVFEVGPECEFFLFHTDDNGNPTTLTHEQAGYFDVGPLDFGENARRDMIFTLEEMGLEVESSHHEVSPAQHEIDFAHAEALKTADNIMTFRLAVRTIAKRHGLHATFMPKPKAGVDGSGLHINMSLMKDGKNIFEDKNGKYGLSTEGMYFLGGIMKHIKGITAVTNPLVNSYKRLVPGFEAPRYIAWNATNKSPLIRIPDTTYTGARIELRSPDPSANPYLAIALCLQAGLSGIKEKTMPPKSVDIDLFRITKEQIEQYQLDVLPSTLADALQEMKADPCVKEWLGDVAFHKYIEEKNKEWQIYNSQITDWEIDTYLNRF